MKKPFTSIRYPLGIDAGLGRLSVEENYAEHVEQMIKQVLLTSPGERINRPDFGCGVRQMVFAPNSEIAANLVQVAVFQALDKWLATVIDVLRVEVETRQEILEIKIAYTLIALQERRYLNLEVTL